MAKVALDHLGPLTPSMARLVINRIRMAGGPIPDAFVLQDDDQLREWERSGLVVKFGTDVGIIATIAGVPVEVDGKSLTATAECC